LVILAIIVVISLVVVGLVTGVVGSPSTQINSSTDKIGNLTSGGITVVESVSDSSGDSLVKLQNNSGETLTLEKVMVGENETTFNEQLVTGDNKTFSLSDLDLSCPCTDGQDKVSCNFTFYLTTSTGLQKKQVVTVKTQCQPTVEATNPAEIIGLGSGTLLDPWIINSCSELQNISQHLDGNYSLGADINCLETRTWNDLNGFIPIGANSPFTGTLNGANKTISGLYINIPTTDKNIGLFGSTSSAAIIQNIGLIDQNVIGVQRVGGLIGMNQGSVLNSYTTGSTRGSTVVVGGLIGYNYGIVSNSHSSGSVTGVTNVGGLIGTNYDVITSDSFGIISNSYSSCATTGSGNYVGGLIGSNYYGSVLNSYSSGVTTGSGSYVGGLVGYKERGNILNSYSSGVTTGSGSYVSGLVGYNWYGSILNSYSLGSTVGGTNVGGIAGYNSFSSILNSLSVGSVTGTSTVGGIVGGNPMGGTVSNSYWDISRTGKAVCCGSGSCSCVGKNSANSDVNAWFPKASLNNDYNVPMQHNAVATNDWTFGLDKNWVAQDNNYPKLSWQ
jgi:hypothetical protein